MDNGMPNNAIPTIRNSIDTWLRISVGNLKNVGNIRTNPDISSK